MTIRLLNVGERLSLEMDPCGLEQVREYIGRTYPDMTRRPAGIVTLIRFGGSEFIFQNEWDEPCMVSQTPEGDALLRELASQFR